MRRRRTVRRWPRRRVGLLTSYDVHDLQDKVAAYMTQLSASIEAYTQSGKAMPTTGPWTDAAWSELAQHCVSWAGEVPAIIFSQQQFDRGRDLLSKLDGWRDWLASVNAPNVPQPIPVPPSELSLGGALGWGAMLFVAAYVFLESRHG